jgi:hypothetical protein
LVGAPIGEGQPGAVGGDQGFAVEDSESGVGERGIGVTSRFVRQTTIWQT